MIYGFTRTPKIYKFTIAQYTTHDTLFCTKTLWIIHQKYLSEVLNIKARQTLFIYRLRSLGRLTKVSLIG